MGVKDLGKFFAAPPNGKRGGKIWRNIFMSELRGKRVAIDYLNYCYTIMIVTRNHAGKGIKARECASMEEYIHEYESICLVEYVGRMSIFIKRMIRDYKITPVFVCDKKPSKDFVLCKKVLAKRKEYKMRAWSEACSVWDKFYKDPEDISLYNDFIKYLNRSFKLKDREIELGRMICRKLGISFVEADKEGESLCVDLLLTDKVDVIASNDTDIFPHLVTRAFMMPLETKTGKELLVVKNFWNSYGNMQLAKVDKHFFRLIDLYPFEFLELCILLSTDYAKRSIYRIGRIRAYKIIKRPDICMVEDLEKDPKFMEKYGPLCVKNLCPALARSIFMDYTDFKLANRLELLPRPIVNEKFTKIMKDMKRKMLTTFIDLTTLEVSSKAEIP